VLSLLAPSREDVLARVDELLESPYRSADLGNVDDVLDETVFILLSRQTRGTVYQQLFRELRHSFPTWLAVREASLSQLQACLRRGGFHRQRAAQLHGLLAMVQVANSDRLLGPFASEPGDLTLEFLREMPDVEAEEFLLRLPGIGPKSARCILAYSLRRPAFAVDTHVHRIMTRLGVVESQGRKLDHDPFQDVVPPKMRKRLHVNLIHHGQAICRSNNERCAECVLVSFCQRGRTRLGDDRPVAIDLFAGAGGLSEGFLRAGFRVGLAVEAERSAAQTYRFNHPGVPVIEAMVGPRTRAADLRKWLPPRTKVDALIAGPPCQGYSTGGHRRPEAPSNGLYRHVARLARQLDSEYVVMENVPGIRSVRGHGFLELIRTELEKAGYHVKEHLLRASDFGVPQARLRYFFLCRRRQRGVRDAPSAPVSTHRRYGDGLGDMTKPETPSVLEALSPIPVLPHGVTAEPYYLADDGAEYLNMSTMDHSQPVREKIARIPPGGGPLSYRRLSWTEAKTLVAGHRAMPVHPEVDRAISVREAALLQGFPVGYRFMGTRSQQPLQVVNAVPPPLADAVAATILQSVKESTAKFVR
jgi:DNA (cytosine-5)-methyltransferase 1